MRLALSSFHADSVVGGGGVAGPADVTAIRHFPLSSLTLSSSLILASWSASLDGKISTSKDSISIRQWWRIEIEEWHYLAISCFSRSWRALMVALALFSSPLSSVSWSCTDRFNPVPTPLPLLSSGALTVVSASSCC